jgi:hypothetical protein
VTGDGFQIHDSPRFNVLSKMPLTGAVRPCLG